MTKYQILKEQNKELLETLIDQCKQLEDIGFIANHTEFDHPIKLIERVDGRKWEDIRKCY
jgi:hypothetical protein